VPIQEGHSATTTPGAPTPDFYIQTNEDGYMDFINTNAAANTVAATSNNAATTTTSCHHHRHNSVTSEFYDKQSQQLPYPSFSTRTASIFPRWMRECGSMLYPARLAGNIVDILVQSFFLWVGVPCLLSSFAFYYCLENYELEFLPGNATASWWLLFACRQTVTLGLARMTVYVVVDGFMLGTHLAIKALGPLLTLTAATGKGWPLIVAFWGLWNMLVLHGTSAFQCNWLGWTRIRFFQQTHGGDILNSTLYTRILCSLVLGGAAVCAKRTVLALRFGRKQFAEFKPRLERILADVVLLSDIAGLADQSALIEGDDGIDNELQQVPNQSWDLLLGNGKKNKKESLKDILWVQPPEAEVTPSMEDDSTSPDSLQHVSSQDKAAVEQHANNNNNNNNNNMVGEYNNTAKASDNKPVSHSQARMSRQTMQTDSGRWKIKSMLDVWEEPDSKEDKVRHIIFFSIVNGGSSFSLVCWQNSTCAPFDSQTSDISISDILKFRKALSHLDEDFLFGEAFGSTHNRDECIESAHAVYFRLLTLSPGSNLFDSIKKTNLHGVLPFDVLALLTLKEDGTENLTKKRMIRRIFTPDTSGGLPLLAFVQACDKIYKRLRYFRASIRNASVIDGVLERLANGVFYFVLFMVLSSLMQLNPWALLVSTTSLLVSVSFALGSSVSKYVEG